MLWAIRNVASSGSEFHIKDLVHREAMHPWMMKSKSCLTLLKWDKYEVNDLAIHLLNI